MNKTIIRLRSILNSHPTAMARSGGEAGNSGLGGFLYLIVAICTAIIGHHIHGSVFWAIVDFFVCPLVWIKWLICQEVNMTIIKGAFAFFLQ